ncbi:HD domain-containing protein [Desulfosporosinus sp. Sb-LF]|uniref:HD domain-containing protein n=1 Tax=Desulfosporosinus sp. Sb-LF TaxID=2560027 RepID=UPI00107F62AF|nr:diguanylate cyclase [Desulfosporosinus sp. Sb-LF]
MMGNVMIIDDSPVDRKIISQILETRLKGIKLFEAEDGSNIKEKLISNGIHMCILDIIMPIKNGFEILQEIKDDPILMDIPVIVCTGMEDKYTIEKALTLGAYDYFAKPLSEEVMKISLPLKVKNAIELMIRKQQIIYLSYHDKLTGLYNRRFFEERLKLLDTPANLPIAILMGDIDGLKVVNDAFGHDKGDELLIKAAASVQGACRRDDLIARWGGDELVILLIKTNNKEVEEIVNRIKDLNVNETVYSIQVSITFGWDTKHDTDQELQKVLKGAEDSMYRNKITQNQGTRGSIVNTIIKALHEKNPREEQHSKRVGEMCENIGQAMGLSEMEVNRLKTVGLLHDIGKIAIDEGILNKPGKLIEREWDEIKRHPEIGYRILGLSYEMLELADCILAHHERWDGAGYPKGLKGEAIPRVARIIALADSYDAMTSERSYRNALSEEEACLEIRRNAGTQFDPYLARVFVEQVLAGRWN